MRAAKSAEEAKPDAHAWGSDSIADLLRALDLEYIALTPGASFRGLHDSLVNHLGNTRPQLLLCVHEEHAVAIAHGYAKVTGRPMAVALHSNVGLMHATMAIFNAWCDRVPVLILGAVGPVDAMKRRPWVDWIHTASDLGALVRGYTKWDDQPGSVAASLESVLRAHKISMTPPRGPVYVCVDAGLQEQEIDGPLDMPPVERFGTGRLAVPSSVSVDEVAAALKEASRPLILMGRVSSDPEDWKRRVELAERLNAHVITDLKTGATFPTAHPLCLRGPALFLTDTSSRWIRTADLILSLDWIDLGGSLRQACGGGWPQATVISCSLDQYVHNGFSMDYQALPPADISILASPDELVTMLLDVVKPRSAPAPVAPPEDVAREEAVESPPADCLSIEALARVSAETFSAHKPSYVRLPVGWPAEYCHFAHPLDYIGYDGGGGIGSGPGMAVGAALALRGSARLPVAIIGDGDYLMGLTAMWTAVHYRVPVLIVVANNQSFFNDELHQERVARLRDRPIENRWVGMRMSDPPMNLATLAEGQGARGFGPVRDEAHLASALEEAIAAVKSGATCVVDVHVAPEYARATSSAVVRDVAK